MVVKQLNQLLFSFLLSAAERGQIPDLPIRWGIRHLLAERINQLNKADRKSSLEQFLHDVQNAPIAVATEKANEQHYELPAEFFQYVLGKRLKYSSCYWPDGVKTLDKAEEAALAVTCQRADLQDGQEILELGCGWGSLSLWMAEHFPNSQITAISNSTPQRQFILERAREQGLGNLKILTIDVNRFESRQQFDRVVSVEMFEHMRNHSKLLRAISDWLCPEGKLFVHIFCHRTHPYLFETDGDHNWMGRYFFTGGMMPSVDFLPCCESPLQHVGQWYWDGTHYARTCRSWLDNLDFAKERLQESLTETYGSNAATCWHNRWRMFFMACEELFGFNGGEEWFVTHHLFQRTK